eukprot:scaffold68195_cov33-Attheya_sp.AAC.1
MGVEVGFGSDGGWDAVVVGHTWEWGLAVGDVGRGSDVGGLRMLSDASKERTSTCSNGASSVGRKAPSHGASRRQSLSVQSRMSRQRRWQQRLPRLGCGA